MGVLKVLKNLFFEPENSTKSEPSQKKINITDFFFEESKNPNSTETDKKPRRNFFENLLFESSPENSSATILASDDEISILDDIPSQIKCMKSELKNLAEFFKTVKPKDYPDSVSEYTAYMSLIKQLENITSLVKTSQSQASNPVTKRKIQTAFEKFNSDYNKNIYAIQSLCYLSELAKLNDEMKELFSDNFTAQIVHRIDEIKKYISLISKKREVFSEKYRERLLKTLIECEYRSTLLNLMVQLNEGTEPRKNPFADFGAKRKKMFAAYISEDISDTNSKYNEIAQNKEKYIKYYLIIAKQFETLDADAEEISEKLNNYAIDDFVLDELFENGDRFETLKKFLRFKLTLNHIDSKTSEANRRWLKEQAKSSHPRNNNSEPEDPDGH